MKELNLENPLPLYAQLSDIIREKIVSGEYNSDQRLPTEIEISREYKVSLITVKKALNDLVNENLIFRRPRLGTFLTSFTTDVQKDRTTLNCFKLSHLSFTETVDQRIKEIFDNRYRNHQLKFQVISSPGHNDSYINNHIRETDIVVVNFAQFRQLSQLHFLIDLTGYLKNSKIITGDSYFPKAMEPFEENGKIYAVPQNFNVTMLYCNKKLFNRVGIDPLKVVWDWKNFAEFARALTVRSNKGGTESWGFGYFLSPATFWENFVLQAGGRLFDAGYSKFLIDSPESLEAFRFLEDVVVKNGAGIDLNSVTDISRFLLEDRVAMTMCGPYMHHILKENIKDWVVLPLPKGKVPATSSGSFGLGITKFCSDPGFAWKFLELYCGPTGQSLLCSESHVMPSLRSIAQELFVKSNRHLDNMESFLDVTDTAHPLPYPLSLDRIRIAVNTRIEMFLSGRENLKETVINLKNEVENALRHYHQSQTKKENTM